MNVVYASDDHYAMIVGTSIESLYQHHSPTLDVYVYILDNQISDKNRALLDAIGKKHGRQIKFIRVEAQQFNGIEAELDTQRWSLASFARLLTPILLPELSRILYLDCDTMVQNSLIPLWEEELGENSCAAVAEPFSVGHKRNVRLKGQDIYFNSGVMLIDLDKWRKMDILKPFFRCIDKHGGHVPYVDQGVINEVLNHKIGKLPAKYNVFTEYYDFSYEEVNVYRGDQNVYSKDEIEEAKREPCVIHFTSSFLTARPWIENSTHPYKDAWIAYRDCTPWSGSKCWPNKGTFPKNALKWIFDVMPRRLAIYLARLTNSVVRPIIDR